MLPPKGGETFTDFQKSDPEVSLRNYGVSFPSCLVHAAGGPLASLTSGSGWNVCPSLGMGKGHTVQCTHRSSALAIDLALLAIATVVSDTHQ